MSTDKAIVRCSECRALVFAGADEQEHREWHRRVNSGLDYRIG